MFFNCMLIVIFLSLTYFATHLSSTFILLSSSSWWAPFNSCESWSTRSYLSLLYHHLILLLLVTCLSYRKYFWTIIETQETPISKPNRAVMCTNYQFLMSPKSSNLPIVPKVPESLWKVPKVPTSPHNSKKFCPEDYLQSKQKSPIISLSNGKIQLV